MSIFYCPADYKDVLPIDPALPLYLQALSLVGNIDDPLVDELHDSFMTPSDSVAAIRLWACKYQVQLDCSECGGTGWVRSREMLNDHIEFPVDAVCPECRVYLPDANCGELPL